MAGDEVHNRVLIVDNKPIVIHRERNSLDLSIHRKLRKRREGGGDGDSISRARGKRV